MPLPIERPGKIVAAGLNYHDHAREQKLEPPERPTLFAIWQTSLIGDGETIVVPPITTKADYEAELGVVVGTGGRGIRVDDALDHVAGYLCLNDVSARDLQRSDGQFARGKSLDTFTPIGPRLVPASDVPDPQALAIRCLLNGEVMQDSNTAEMVFSVAQLIAYVSEAITLEPGDLIATGTPGGVGAYREPRVFLQDGDEVTVEIEGIGRLTNPVRVER